MLMYSESLELRGVERKVSQKTNNPYLVFHLEETTGNSLSFVCKDEAVLKPDYKKGDKFTAVFEYSRFGKVERVALIGLERESK